MVLGEEIIKDLKTRTAGQAAGSTTNDPTDWGCAARLIRKSNGGATNTGGTAVGGKGGDGLNEGPGGGGGGFPLRVRFRECVEDLERRVRVGQLLLGALSVDRDEIGAGFGDVRQGARGFVHAELVDPDTGVAHPLADGADSIAASNASSPA